MLVSKFVRKDFKQNVDHLFLTVMLNFSLQYTKNETQIILMHANNINK